jgi:MoaA/NifB/PqqE/SkfB family radical SAM enzyme
VLGLRLPAVCDCSVTNVCNAACDFCSFSREKTVAGHARYVSADDYARALPILHRRGIRFMTLQGGEPLVHPEIVRLVADTCASGIQCGVITNAWFLPRYIDALAAAGLARLIVSVDSDRLAEHERNRGLDGLTERMAEGITRAKKFGIPVNASVTVNRLVNYEELPDTLQRLGFEAVGCSYPRRSPLGSTSLVFNGDSRLVDFDRDELLDAVAAIDRFKSRFPVVNPRASLAEVARYIRGEPQAVPCVGGHKYFYLDWNLNIWRCEAWKEPLGSVFDLDRIPDRRDPCNACMVACYRNASMLMHAGVAAGDVARSLARGDIGAAGASLFHRGVGLSLGAVVEQLTLIRRIVKGRRAVRPEPIGP